MSDDGWGLDWPGSPSEDFDCDSIILPNLMVEVDRVKASEELSAYLEKIINTSDAPVITLDRFLTRMQYHTRGFLEDFITPKGTVVMSMEAILMRAVLYLWYRCPDLPTRHTRQALGMVPMAVSSETKNSVMHATRGVPNWWPDYQIMLFKDIHRCFSGCNRARIDATFGYRMVYLSCYMTDRISPMNIGNYCLEEAKLSETLIIAMARVGQKTQKDDHYLGDVIGRALSENRPIYYSHMIAVAAFFLNNTARMFIKDRILAAILTKIEICNCKDNYNFSDCWTLGLHSKKFIMLSLCKLLVEFMPHKSTMEAILSRILKLCPRLQLAYKLLRTQQYLEEDYDCLPTCLELAFPTYLDDPNHFRYLCEFNYFRDTLRYMGRKNRTLLQEILQKLDPHSLDFYKNRYKPGAYLTKLNRETCKFQCMNHRFQPDHSNVCPIMGRECLVKRPKESHFV